MTRRPFRHCAWLVLCLANAAGRFLDRVGGLNPDHSNPYRPL